MAGSTKPETRKRRKRRGPGRPYASDVVARQEDLLNVATAEFLKNGFANTSVTEIARKAGASKRTIYSRYATKAALFIAVITRKTRELQSVFAKILTPNQPLGIVLEDFGTHLLRAIAHPQRRSLYKIFVAESGKFPRLSIAFWETGPQRSVAMLGDYLATHPEFHGKDPEDAAEMFWSLCCGFLFIRSQLHQNMTIADKIVSSHAQEAVRIFLSAYSDVKPASEPVKSRSRARSA